MDNNGSQKTRTISYAVIAIVAALALFGVVVLLTVTVTISLQQQQAEAAGCTNGVAVNASKGRCFGH